MNRTKTIFPALLLLGLALTACDKIADDERLIYVKPADVGRKVLIEDYTGQQCIHCPRGTLVIQQIQEQYGDDVVAVGVHSGPLGFKGSPTVVGLATDLGDEYYNYWRVEAQPSGVINRSGGTTEYTSWTTRVNEEIQKQAPLDIDIEARYDAAANSIDIVVNTLGTNGRTEGNLQLWVIEDSITALQLRFNEIDNPMSGQIYDSEYVHNHVLRDAVNGAWGEPYTTAEGQQQTFNYTLTPAAEWVPEHLSIVAFVYNAQGVAQVEKEKVKAPIE